MCLGVADTRLRIINHQKSMQVYNHMQETAINSLNKECNNKNESGIIAYNRHNQMDAKQCRKHCLRPSDLSVRLFPERQPSKLSCPRGPSSLL